MIRSLWCFVAAVLLFVGEAAAHDVWLRADGARQTGQPCAVGERIDVRLLVGHGTEEPSPVSRNDRLLAAFEARGPADTIQPVPGLHGIDPAGVFRPDRPGLWSVTYEGRPVEHRLDAAAFESYLTEEGLDWVLERRRDAGESELPGRELFSRSLEVLVPVGDADLTRGMAAAETDLPVRFRLTTDGETAGLQLLWNNRPVAGALVDLRRDDRLVTSVRTDGDGRIRLRPEPGIWVVTAVVLEAVDEPRADWRTIFTALTFPWPDSSSERAVAASGR